MIEASLPLDVLRDLDAAGIAHCHWKSNEHLDAALEGLTDLDLLIDTARLDDAYRILSAHGCRRGRVSPMRNEPGLEDFLGADPVTGRLVHFHVHYRLASGERHLKRFRLPFERDILETRIQDAATGAWMTETSREIVLALVRASLKLRWRDRAKAAVKRVPKASLVEEVEWLLKRSDPTDVEESARRWFGDAAAATVRDCLESGPTGARLAKLRRQVLRWIGPQTSHTSMAAAVVRWRREVAWFQRGVARHVAPRPVLYGRGGPGGGLLVAVVGADGSGKSTLVKELRAWFSPKFDTYFLYFGSGDGPASLLRWPLNQVKRLVMGPKGSSERKASAEQKHPGAMKWSKAVWALVLAHEKQSKLDRALMARTRGLLVVTDRFPQTQILGTNDGPLLAGWSDSSNPLFRWMAKVERRPYDAAARFGPDLVIRLDVDPDTAVSRRPDHGAEYLARRIEIVRSLEFPSARFGVVTIDGTQPFETVLRTAVDTVLNRL